MRTFRPKKYPDYHLVIEAAALRLCHAAAIKAEVLAACRGPGSAVRDLHKLRSTLATIDAPSGSPRAVERWMVLDYIERGAPDGFNIVRLRKHLRLGKLPRLPASYHAWLWWSAPFVLVGAPPGAAMSQPCCVARLGAAQHRDWVEAEQRLSHLWSVLCQPAPTYLTRQRQAEPTPSPQPI